MSERVIGVASSGVANPVASSWLAPVANSPTSTPAVVLAGGEDRGDQLVTDPSTGRTYDPTEWLAGEKRLVYRCQQGRFDSWNDGRTEQCPYPAMRGQRVCADHGGVPVAKKRLLDAAVPMTEALIEIALDPDEKTADRLAAINSGLDRAGGLGRTVAQPEPEVRSALLARIEQAAAEYEQQLDQAERTGATPVVAAQEAPELGAGQPPSGTPLLAEESSPVIVQSTMSQFAPE